MQGSHIPTVEGHVPPPAGYSSWDEYMTEIEALAERWSVWGGDTRDRRSNVWQGYDEREARRLTKAMRLAPSALVFDALLADQPVPVAALDPSWRKRYAA